MSTRPFLSVVLPTCNGAEHLRAALDSLCRQTLQERLEVIAVDDGSTDATRDILFSFEGKLPLDAIARPHVGNWVASANHGLERARGDFVCFLHQDDLWAAGRLAVLKETIAAYPRADVLLGPVRFIDGFGRPIGRWTCPLPSKRPLEPSEWFPPLLVQNFIAIATPIVKREAALDAWPLDETLRYSADWKFWLRLATRATAVVLPDCLASFRVHPAAQTFACANDLDEYRRQLETVLAEFLPLLDRFSRTPGRWKRPARYSIEVNVALAALAQGRSRPLGTIALGGLALGPPALFRYLRYSRVTERAWARLRSRLASPPRS